MYARGPSACVCVCMGMGHTCGDLAYESVGVLHTSRHSVCKKSCEQRKWSRKYLLCTLQTLYRAINVEWGHEWGLALRDISAAHFNEELPEDAPDWLKISPLDINSTYRLSEIWGKQLQPAKPAMKAKAKANTKTATESGKRKVPPNEDSKSEERIPRYV